MVISTHTIAAFSTLPLPQYNPPPPPPPSKPPTVRTRLSQLCKDGQPDVAHRLFQSIPRPTTVLWNTIIIGYICNGMPYHALRIYSQMLSKSSLPSQSDSYTYSSVLKACAETEQIRIGKIIHCRVLRSHSKITGIVSNSLLNMYCSCFGSDLVVEKVFDEMPKRNVVAWNTMIAWYVKAQRFEKAIKHFVEMVRLGIKPTVVSFVNVFPAVAAVGQDGNKYAGLLYGLLIKCGTDYVDDSFAVSSAISMYSELANMDAARKIFDSAANKNIEVWNTMIGGYVQNDCHWEALHLFEGLMGGVDEAAAPDTVTFLASLTTASQLQWLDLGKQLHACVVKNSMAAQVIVSNSLISMYSKCNSVEIAFKVFEKMLERDIVSWNTMVSAFVQNGFDDQGLMLVREMKKQSVLIDSITATALLSAASNLRNSGLGKQTHAYVYRHGIRFEGMDSYLVDMYSKSGLIDIAQWVFDNQCVHTRDHVTWNAMIAGYTQNGKTEQAFTVFRQMLVQKETPSSVTLASVLPACIPVGGISLGKQIHGFAIRHLLNNNVFVGTALIDMYSKCASINCAEKIYNSMLEKNSVTYTTMILGYGQHGLGQRAMQMFRKMCESGSVNPPDAITFVSILSACSYCGMVDQGLEIFESMERLYGIVPSAEHYSCVVDMLGRAGRVVEAYEFVQELGEKGNVAGIWGSLLGACRIHGKLELGRIIAERVFDVGKKMDITGYHVLMSNIYADKEMWDSANRVRKDMRDKGLRKVAGCSWIDIGGAVNCFTSRDQKHPQRDAIYAKLEELAVDIEAAGYRHT
ncbi:hypothetical protein ACHQM5_020552 [Ranunculus cassubicifolius]